ncbi:DNA internalization-related competence protein ComEC/Rec2 [Alkalimonas collagenimarina]|uniref:DNA internalization-related competence protein ComEC/Rec2 n=1 Tax=Alkalimonas collagenimarina TaxID=400390 RepID=A0ABT9H149_9GAMM|nr:DNA internalization-related competence protein ComEC/Rec2 [Alkalimonas collagenimarina]MDP4536933.1 DNA internalization-related competence protein ComEC/Rec2 [Alkalimonas collagenimarina]
MVPPFFVFFLLLLSLALLLWRRCWFYCGLCLYLLSWHGTLLMHQQAGAALLQDVQQQVEGQIIGIPRQHGPLSQFDFLVTSGSAKGYRLRLSWFQASDILQQGQHWQLSVRLKPVHDISNPGGYSAERAALIHGQLARGYVSDPAQAQLLHQTMGQRHRWYQRLQQATTDLPSSPLLLALTMGERDFSPELWQGLRHTSLGHLVAISGLHIGLIYGWVLWLVIPIRWTGWLPATQLRVRTMLALSAALGYAALAGFAIPTVRALIALVLVAGVSWFYHRLSYHRFWLLLVALLLLVQPMWALSASFWLSVSAVALILFYLWRFPMPDHGWLARLKHLFGFHLWLSIGLIPISLLFFDGISLISLLSNLIFVPWCSLVAIPALLLTCLLEWLHADWAAWLWPWVDLLFRPLVLWLDQAAQRPVLWWSAKGVPWFMAVLSMLALVMLCLFRHRLAVILALLCLLPLAQHWSQDAGWRLHVIDVGQGLSVLLQYQQHGVLYDAGPRQGDFSATRRYVLPYLQQVGIQQLHYLVLSHDDSDHTGTWPDIRQAFPEVTLVTDIPTAAASLPCQQLPMTFFDARLVVLHDGTEHGPRNDGSCVVWIELHGWNILLPGDIHRQQEQQLLQRYPDLTADLLVLPHHGSNTSSSLAFLQQLQVRVALNSAGRHRGFQHPSAQVQDRLDVLQIPLWNTADHGAIQIALSPDFVQIYSNRASRLPFWLDSVQAKLSQSEQRVRIESNEP